MSGEPSQSAVPAITPAALAACYADARRCHPEESCGLLLGPVDAALCDEARPCQNQQNRMHALDRDVGIVPARVENAGAPDMRGRRRHER